MRWRFDPSAEGASTVTRPTAGAVQTHVGPAGWNAGGALMAAARSRSRSQKRLCSLRRGIRPYADVALACHPAGSTDVRTALTYQPPNDLDLHGA